MFVGICNPDALNIRICNPKIALKLILHAGGLFVGICNPDALIIRISNPKIALKKMLKFHAGGLQIHLSVESLSNVRRDLQSRRVEYQDLQSENRIKNASTQFHASVSMLPKEAVQPEERAFLFAFAV